MRSTDAVVIGAGQAGLAASHQLGRFGIEHVVLERGRIAERWRSERWDSLRLLTPNWMTTLPGHAYAGPHPDGFMSLPELIEFLSDYAAAFNAPVLEGIAVGALRPIGEAWHVETNAGCWRARSVVVATGACARPAVPDFAATLSPAIHQLPASAYRNPAALPPGGVLVVGAAASAVQIAEELSVAGREVAIAVGRHTRAPRSYRGRDIFWWMHHVGLLEDRAEDQRDLRRAASQPSLQLVGGLPRRDLDLGALRDRGVRVLGRATGAEGTRMRFADDLALSTAGAQRPMESMLARIDVAADALGAPQQGWPAAPGDFAPTPPELDLAGERVGSVVWATGYRRDNGWLGAAGLLDDSGEIRHRLGIGALPGLFVLGLRFMRRRSSSFIGGVGIDAAVIAGELARHLSHQPSRAAA
ncbi:NAD(P)-binding domain-containing protein [Falsiroseomonas sp. HW251]|uniref:NAD(P)-binding domain-containing protein n=1 Tax=Falsiroseomonas sp. HW251 TaxID=3390998 RepID=UPI003D32328F